MLSPSVYVGRGHASVKWGSGGSALPNAPPSRPKPWWNHKKLDCLSFVLGATRMRPSFPPFLQIPAAIAILPPSRRAPFTSHYTDAAPSPQLSHVMGSFPLRCRNTKCSIKPPIAACQQRRRQQQSPSNGQCITLMGGAICLEAAWLCWISAAPIYHFYHKSSVRKDGWKEGLATEIEESKRFVMIDIWTCAKTAILKQIHSYQLTGCCVLTKSTPPLYFHTSLILEHEKQTILCRNKHWQNSSMIIFYQQLFCAELNKIPLKGALI